MKKTVLLLALTAGVTTGYGSKASVAPETYKAITNALFPAEEKNNKNNATIPNTIDAGLEAIENVIKEKTETSVTDQKNEISNTSIWSTLSGWVSSAITNVKKEWNYFFFKRALRRWIDIVIVKDAMKANATSKEITAGHTNIEFSSCKKYAKTSTYEDFQKSVFAATQNKKLIEKLESLFIDKPAEFITNHCKTSPTITAFLLQAAVYDKRSNLEKDENEKDEKAEVENSQNVGKEADAEEKLKVDEDNSMLTRFTNAISSFWGSSSSTSKKITKK